MIRRHIARAALGLAALAVGSAASAAPIIIDDFETTEGRFASAPTLSGSNRNVASGAADRTTDRAFTGTASELVSFNAAVPPSTPAFEGTMLRFLSGGGSPANNVNIGQTGFVGYFIATTTEGLRTGIGLDDGTTLERGALQDVIADGQFRLYQFSLAATDFARIAGTGGTAGIDAPATIDSIFVLGPAGVNPTFYIDTVAYNPDGDLSALVPEPGSLALVSCGALGLLARRRRV